MLYTDDASEIISRVVVISLGFTVARIFTNLWLPTGTHPLIRQKLSEVVQCPSPEEQFTPHDRRKARHAIFEVCRKSVPFTGLCSTGATFSSILLYQTGRLCPDYLSLLLLHVDLSPEFRG